jgi:uncharacterized protein Yka (UPF0111/DUF47 family)
MQHQLEKLTRSFDEQRAEEYNLLVQLVNTAGSLNKGSGIVDKIKALESMADRLTRSDMVEPRQSFMQWLGDVAHYFYTEND